MSNAIHQTIIRVHHLCAFQSLFPHIYLANTLLLCTITSLRMSVHFHKYLQHFAAKDYPLITPVPAPSNLLQFWKKKKKRNTPNYNLIYHPEAGIIFHLSPNPPYSPLLLFPSPPSIVITHRLEMDPSRVSRSHGKRSTATSEEPNPGEESRWPIYISSTPAVVGQMRAQIGRSSVSRPPFFPVLRDHLPSYVQLRPISSGLWEVSRDHGTIFARVLRSVGKDRL